MGKAKSPKDSLSTDQRIILPNEVGKNEILLSGTLMSWVENIASKAAQLHAGPVHPIAVNIDQIHFASPLKLGDHAYFTSSVDCVGRTSMVVGVQVEKADPLTNQRTFTASVLITYVALGEHRRPVVVPRLLPESVEELERYQCARIRSKFRGRLHNWFQERFPLVFQSKVV